MVQRIAPTIQSPVSEVTYILGPFASLAQQRQRIEELKTRLHINANVKPVQRTLQPAALTKSIAGVRTRMIGSVQRTGALGRPVTATQSMVTGPTS